MARLELEFTSYNDALENIYINGKKQKLIRKRNKTCICTAEVEGDVAEVQIVKSNHYATKNWFWWNLLYFFVSVFGLFDNHQNKRIVSVDCSFRVDTTADKKLMLKIQNFADGGEFVSFLGEEVEQISNIQSYDKEAQKRNKKMKKAKWAIGALCLVVVAVVVVFVII
ncbi:MAG: hypothetical protein IJA69_03160 [Clostridia bacterium]|nr:hypothetical protein [Clostridia bacterium]